MLRALLLGQVNLCQSTHFLGKGDVILIKIRFFRSFIELHILYINLQLCPHKFSRLCLNPMKI
jgi:hypothetical protein